MTIHTIDLAEVRGGAPDAATQARLRALARTHCPQTYAANQSRPITRPLAERCLQEAGLESYSRMLDPYFPRR